MRLPSIAAERVQATTSDRLEDSCVFASRRGDRHRYSRLRLRGSEERRQVVAQMTAGPEEYGDDHDALRARAGDLRASARQVGRHVLEERQGDRPGMAARNQLHEPVEGLAPARITRTVCEQDKSSGHSASRAE